MTEVLKPFPDVDPDQITAAGTQFHNAASELTTAGSRVKSVSGTTSWKSPDARPAWDSTLQARQSDIANAHEVTEHVGNVLRMTGTEVGRSKSDYQTANLMMLYFPDPRQGTVIQQGGILMPDPDPKTVDPQALSMYLAQVRKANQAVDDANYMLALCARELLAVSEGISFAPLPSSPQVAVDPQTFAIIPFAPAFGAPGGAVYANGVPVPPQFGRGRAFEGSILRELGITGGSKDFFRPDANGNYALPRTKSGSLFRGTFPDSTRAGLLEIKSGTSEITLNMPQIRVQRWMANTLGLKWNIVTERDTPIDPDVIDEVLKTGGGVYARVPGNSGVYYDRIEDDYVHLKGGQGPSGRDLEVTPLTPEERQAMENTLRLDAKLNQANADMDESTLSGPTQPYVTENEENTAWGKADISPDGDTPLPGAPEDDVPGEPLEPGEPLPIEPEPVEPVIPIGPEDIIP